MSAIHRICPCCAMAICLVLVAAQRSQPITACLFTPDGESIIVAHHDSLAVRSVANGSQQRRLGIKLDRICAVAFHPKGQLLAVAGGVPGTSGSVILWDWKADVALGEIRGFQDVATAVDFSPDGQQLVVASADKTAQIHQLKGSAGKIEVAAVLNGHAGPITAVQFSPDGSTVLTCSTDRSIKLWEAESGKLIRTFTNHTDPVHCLAIRPVPQSDEKVPWTAASAGDDKTVRIWQPAIGRMVRIIRKHDGPVLTLAYTPDGSKLFSAGAEGVIRVIDADSDQIISAFSGHDDWIYALAASPDGKWLVAGDWGGNLRLWDLRPKMPKRAW